MRLERIFGSKMQTRLVEYLLQNHTKVFNQAGLSRFLRCSPSTIARIIEPLVQEGIILYEQISGQMKILALNLESEKVKVLIDFYEKIKKL
ncbi:MAG: hypothetical protein ACKD6N_01125 [Candidatus Bathyarchaeota archaeon]